MGPLIFVIVLFLVVFVSCIKVVPQANAFIVERLGAYQSTWSVGLHIKLPFFDRVARKVNLKEQVADFPPQPVITKDNVTMRIDTVVFYQITDPKLYAYGVENPMQAIENLTATTLRNIIGDLELDETLTSRETINTKMRATLDVATDPWGIKVNRVELKNIIPPAEIQNAMEKQMKAERERREAVTRAEGDKKARILEAEGNKESAILNAEAEKQAMILHADAHKQKMILEAEGQAEAILKVQQAKADGLKLLKDAEADGAVLKLKSLEAFEKVADGQATTILLPADLQGIASMGVALEQGIKSSRDAKPGVKRDSECEAPHSGYEDCP
ncbi:MAG: SPFH/Band 7/PHB domain protein [Lachnospiraceae bacterium]|jgi:regulator of protease activity HflC (stomatin/prohibitin superfamily)|nr:SPFH/Band 7/PHB domain protein [Lachnospiraceae bacterium]